MPSQPTSRDRVIKRLGSYWKMEAGNVFLIPAIILWLVDARISWLTAFAFLPMMGMLVIGAFYWRAKFGQIADGRDITSAVRTIAQWQMPMLVLSALAVIAATALWLQPALSKGRADQWAATASALLAALEYVNYYHRQLQHFDHLPDWKRLLSGRGFRRSQLREDIERLG